MVEELLCDRKSILFATDLSPLSDAVLPVATSIARQRGAQLVIFHVEETPTGYPVGEWLYGPLEPTPGALEQLRERVKPADLRVPSEYLMGFGEPANEIVRVAEETEAELIVMSTHGRTGLPRFIMGSVAEKVVRKAACPVLIVKPLLNGSKEAPNPFDVSKARTILVPIDFSRVSEAAIQVATSLACDSGAQLIIAHVEQPLVPYGGGEVYCADILDAHTRALKMALENIKPDDPRVACTHRLLSGDPAGEIVRLAQEENADMIVTSTHGRKGLSHALLGSVAEAIVRRAKCPVLTLRHAPAGSNKHKAVLTNTQETNGAPIHH